MDYILKNSKLCFGPMSKNIVDGIIKYSNKTKTNITLIPSRRQIEWDGGYVNNWTTEQFSKYVKNNSKYIAIQRDHGGPGQGLHDDDGYISLKHDCKYFDSIHIDPWKKYENIDEGINWTIDILNFCYNENPNLYFEIGTEEAIRKFNSNDIENILYKVKNTVKKEIFDRIIFCVIQSGTSLQNGKNIGNYENERLIKMINKTKKYNLLSKEHNGDYMKKHIMVNRFENGLDSLNIAPELGVYETKYILNQIKEQSDKIDLFYNLCLKSNKWKKWVSDSFNPENNKIKLIEICGHYVFSNEMFKKNIYELLDKTEIIDYIYEYLKKIYFVIDK